MLLTNDTPLAALAFEQWHPNGASMAVIVARGRVRVNPDGSQYIEKRELALADRFEGDPHKTPMVEVGDLIPFKPFADVSVVGSIQAREPAEFVEGGIRVADTVATVRGCGERRWYYEGRWRLSDPDPVIEVPLDWRLASGGRIVGDPDGAVDPRNPIGPGLIDTDYTSTKIELPAARIDSTAHPVTDDSTDRPEPQGLGPVPQWWRCRQRYAGTYDADWEENVHPRLPADFDYRHYQTASPALVLPHYLQPGMDVRIAGLQPGGDAFALQVPDLVPYATFRFSDGRTVPVRLHMDGLHLDLRGETISYDLTWRAWIETCPSFLGVDLAPGRTADAEKMQLPMSGPEGLVAA